MLSLGLSWHELKPKSVIVKGSAGWHVFGEWCSPCLCPVWKGQFRRLSTSAVCLHKCFSALGHVCGALYTVVVIEEVCLVILQELTLTHPNIVNTKKNTELTYSGQTFLATHT